MQTAPLTSLICTPIGHQNADTIQLQNSLCIPVNPPQEDDSKSDNTESISQNTAPVFQYPATNQSSFNNLPHLS